jgi:hypothetical protein
VLIDLYTLPHKALRCAVGEASTVLGALGPDDACAAAASVAEVVDVLLAHAAHEDEFIEPLLERHLPDAAFEIARQHGGLTAAIDGLRRQADHLAATANAEPGALLALYRAFERMAAANLVHLDHEESVVMPALWQAVPATELAALMDAFRAAHPDATELYRRWPNALTPAERTMLGLAHDLAPVT